MPARASGGGVTTYSVTWSHRGGLHGVCYFAALHPLDAMHKAAFYLGFTPLSMVAAPVA